MSLGEGWEEVWSQEGGAFYYLNKLTGESSWERPEYPASAAAVAAEQPAAAVAAADPAAQVAELHAAVSEGDADALEALLQAMTPRQILTRDHAGNTAMHLAAAAGYSSCMYWVCVLSAATTPSAPSRAAPASAPARAIAAT